MVKNCEFLDVRATGMHAILDYRGTRPLTMTMKIQILKLIPIDWSETKT